MMLRSLLAGASALTLSACLYGSATTLDSVTVGSAEYKISYEEEEPEPGSTTNFILDPSDDERAAEVVCWVGSAGDPDTIKKPAVYDTANEGFDVLIVIPKNVPHDSRFFFTVQRGADTATGSVHL